MERGRYMARAALGSEGPKWAHSGFASFIVCDHLFPGHDAPSLLGARPGDNRCAGPGVRSCSVADGAPLRSRCVASYARLRGGHRISNEPAARIPVATDNFANGAVGPASIRRRFVHLGPHG